MAITIGLCLTTLTLNAQTHYDNKVYGISFAFPASYKLHQGDLGDKYSLGYLGPIPMEFPAPGGERLATVEIPANLYPNTDLNAAYVTLSINQYLTREECDSLKSDLPQSQKTLALKIDGLEFHGAEIGDAGLGHQFGGTYYHSFLAGTCYEFGEGISTSGYGAVDGMERVDGVKISAILNSILRSVKINAPPPEIVRSPSVLIHSFEVSPISKSSSNPKYRFSWDVTGTGPNEVWLSRTCSGDVSVFDVVEEIPDPPTMLCDMLRPLQSTRGSLELELRNFSGSDVDQTFRLFARGGEPVSKNVTVKAAALPVMISVERHLVYTSPSEEPVRLFAGHSVEILGVAFMPHQTIWLGSIAIPVESADSKTVILPLPEPTGQYPLFIENERGRSNSVTIQIIK